MVFPKMARLRAEEIGERKIRTMLSITDPTGCVQDHYAARTSIRLNLNDTILIMKQVQIPEEIDQWCSELGCNTPGGLNQV